MAQDDIQGQVVDGSGNPVSGAIVELTKSYQSSPTEQEAVQRTTTDANGNYIFDFHPDGDGTTQEWHVAAYNYDGSAYVNSFNNPGVTADLPEVAIPDSGIFRLTFDDDDTSGSTALDVWNDNDGTIDGATTGVSGANVTYTTNEAYDFDGTDDNVSTNVSDLSTPFSTAVWINLDDLSDSRAIIGDFGFGDADWYVQYNDGDEGIKLVDDIESSVLTTAGSQDTWLHVVAVFGDDRNQIYINGTLNAEETFSSNPRSFTSGGGVDIGSLNDELQHFDGTIDDPRLYDKALSSTEVSNLYNTGSI